MITVGFARPADRLDETIRDVIEAGFEPVGVPSMTVAPVPEENFSGIETLLSSGEVFYTLFASVTAVDCVVEYFGKEKLLDLLSKTKVASTGPFTAKRLEDSIGRTSDLVPKVYSGEGVASELGESARGKKILLLRSEGGTKDVTKAFIDIGADVCEVPVYSMKKIEDHPMQDTLALKASKGEVDALLFTSPKSFHFLIDCIKRTVSDDNLPSVLDKIYLMAIGMTTAKEMERCDIPADYVCETSSLKYMLEKVGEHFCE